MKIEDFLKKIVSFAQKGFIQDPIDSAFGALNKLKEQKHLLMSSLEGRSHK